MIKILSIDDSRSVHAVLNEILSELNAEVSHAYNGKDGLEILKNENFDLVLLDWEMPGWTGIETLKHIRSENITVPVLMLTSKNSPDDIMSAIESGATEYAMKPFVSEVLFDKIEAAVGRSVR